MPQPGVAVPVSPAERAAGALTAATLDSVLTLFHRDGFCVLGRGVFPHAALDALVERSDYQAAQFAVAGKGPHIDNGLPRMAPWVSAEVLVNPVVEQLASSILGRGAFQRYWGGNCSLPITAAELEQDTIDECGEVAGLKRLHMDSN